MIKPSKDLIAVWDEKLKKSGFEDIEVRSDNNGPGTLKIWALNVIHHNQERHAVEIEATQEYYILAGQFFHHHEFKSKKEKAIWELHSAGTSIRNIEKLLRKRRFKVYKDLINRTIMRLTEEMLKENVK